MENKEFGAEIQAMGMPEEMHKLKFVQVFRWTLVSEHLPTSLVQTVKFLCTENKLIFSIVQAVNASGKIEALDFKDGMVDNRWPNEVLTFNTYNGCGEILYSCVFTGLKLETTREKFDYSRSDVATTVFVVSYANKQRIMPA